MLTRAPSCRLMLDIMVGQGHLGYIEGKKKEEASGLTSTTRSMLLTCNGVQRGDAMMNARAMVKLQLHHNDMKG